MYGNSNLFNFTLDCSNWNIIITVNLFLLSFAIIVFFIILIVRYFFAKKNSNAKRDVIPIELTLNLGKSNVKYAILRNYLNLEIAHRIYVELITRKAAIEIDENHDVIVETYNSWYSLFHITREEIKKLSGNLLENNSNSEELIKIATDVLNQGLRPHLTEHQARFRKWYAVEINKKENINKTPQEIQAKYGDYANLVASMKEVNKVLMDYAEVLRKFIKGEKV